MSPGCAANLATPAGNLGDSDSFMRWTRLGGALSPTTTFGIAQLTEAECEALPLIASFVETPHRGSLS